jgi:uncharacterized protein
MKQQQLWCKMNGQKINRTIQDEMQAMMAKEKALGHEIKICIGTDSQVKHGIVEYATAIVCVRKGKGAFMYQCKETTKQLLPIKQRMLIEVSKSIEVAYALSNIFIAFNVDMEIHVDINTNPNFKSNDALPEAMGYVKGMGFSCKAKPYAFASSCAANKLVQ